MTQKRTPPPRGPPGTLRLPLSRWPPWMANATTKLLARASHFSSYRPICVINHAWKAGTELPEGKGKLR